MPSALARRLVEPAFSHVPEYVETYGPEVAEVCADAGYVPDPEQEMILDAIFGIRPDGRSASFATTVIAARQTIKTGVAKMATIGWLFVTEQQLVVWSAHEMKTTRRAHMDLANLIEGCPRLSKLLKPGASHGIKYGNSDLSINLRTRQELIFGARTTGGGRGLTGDKVILDEGFALKAEHMAALLPTLNARPDPQILIPSSAGLLASAVLRGYRDRGRGHLSARQAYFEWCSTEEACEEPDCIHLYGVAKGCAMDREHLWQQSMPTYGVRTDREKIEDFRDAMPADEFAREFMVWWDDPTASGPFPTGIWAARADPAIDEAGLAASQITGQVSVAIDMTWDRKACALAVAGTRDDGKVQVELVDEDRTGISWLAERAAKVADAHGADGVRVDPASAAGALIPDLKEAGVNVIEVTGREVAQACGAFYDAVIDNAMVHLGQARLDLAVGGAQKKASGDAWRWDRRHGADISPLMATTLAAWGVGSSGSGFFGPDDLYADPDDDESEEST